MSLIACMNNYLLNHPLISRLAYFVMVCVALQLTAPSFGQRKTTSKSKVSKTTNKRIIYGLASFYANKFQGRRTASGETFSQSKYTGACNMLPLGTWVRVTNMRNKRSVVVKINDRLHTRMRRVIDLSGIAAKKLGYVSRGITRVKIEVIGMEKPK